MSFFLEESHFVTPSDVTDIDWSNPITRGLVGCWTMNQGTIYVRDLVDGSFAEPFNITVDVGPRGGYTRHADGSNDRLEADNLPRYNLTDAITISVVAKFSSLGDVRTLVAKGKGGDPALSYDFKYHTANNGLRASLRNSGGTQVNVDGNTAPAAGQIQTYGLTWDDSDNSARIYLDGRDDGGATFNGPLNQNTLKVLLGGIPGWTLTGEMNGDIYSVYLYNRRLSPSEMRSLHNSSSQVLWTRRRWVPVVISGGATVSVGLASELSTAFAISRLKQKPVGFSTETDTALATSLAKVTAVGFGTETDAAFSILRSKIKAAGVSTETDSAFALIISSAVNVGLSAETDSALAINRLKQNPVGLSTETDTALSVGRSKIKIAGLAIETDVAFTISRSKLKALGLSSELDEALAISSSGSLAVGLASELDVALVIGRLKQQALGQSFETDISQPVSKIKTQQAGLSVESDSALAVTGSSGRAVGLATETDLAQSISRIKQRLIGLAPETDVALSITIAGVTVVINTNAKETLKLLAENPTLTLSAENATLTLS